MQIRCTKASGVAALRFIAVIFIIWGGNIYGKDDNRIIADKEITAMAVSQTRPAVPHLDAAQPANFATATFALG
jgi:hypothetical protein